VPRAELTLETATRSSERRNAVYNRVDDLHHSHEAAQGSLIHLTLAQAFGVVGKSRRNQINFQIAFEVQ